MTLTPIRRTAPLADPETIMSAILRTLRDAQAPVPVRDLDVIHPDRRAVAQALTQLTRAGVVDIAAGHVTVSRAHRRAEPDPVPETPEPSVPAPEPQTPKPAPSTHDVLRLITQTLTEHGPMTESELRAHLPRATHPRIPAAITLGTATGQIGQREGTLFAPDPHRRVRRRSAQRQGSA